MNLKNSNDLLEKGKTLIPGATQTYSKGHEFFPEVYPKYLQEGLGSHVRDVDGNEYIDFIMGLGAITLGYKNDEVDKTITYQLMTGGISFSLPHPLEVDLAQKLVDLIPCAQMVRFTKTGSEACSAAVKLARAYTHMKHIAYWGYHGWHDWYSVDSDRNDGIVHNGVIAAG